MAYSKQQWKDEIPDLTKPIKDASGKQKADPQTGRPLYELVQEGTRITSARLNHIEDGIGSAHTQLAELGEDIETHEGDAIRHLTAAERATWNAKETPAAAQQKADASLASAKSYTDTQLLTKADKGNTYSKTETDQRIQAVVGAAPAALDTLKEIGDALNNDPNFAATVTNQLSGKVDKVNGKQLSTEDYTSSDKAKLAGLTAGAGGSGTATDTVIGNRTIVDTEAPTGDAGPPTKLWSWLANMIKAVTGKSSWRTAPAITLEQTKTHVDDSTRHITATERTTWNGKLNSSAVGNANGSVPINNGTVNTNLNADMVDGFHLDQDLRSDKDVQFTGLNLGDKSFSKYMGKAVFNATAVNQKMDLYFTGNLQGYLEVSVTGSWYNAQHSGILTKAYGIHLRAGQTAPDGTQHVRYSEAFGNVASQIALSDVTWDATNSRWRIQIAFLAPTPNTEEFIVRVSGFTTNSAKSLLDTMGLSSIYTTDTTVLPTPVVIYPYATTFSKQIASTVPAGTAPFSIVSSTKVAGLNSDLLDGMDATSSGIASTISSRDTNGDSAFRRVALTVPTGLSPLTVSSNTLVSNLNADMVDGFHASASSAANSIVVQDTNQAINVDSVLIGRNGRLASADALSSIATGGVLQQTTDTSNGYGLWQCANCYWNGTNWIQIRGDSPSYAQGVTLQRGRRLFQAPASGTNGSVITMTEYILENTGGTTTPRLISTAAQGTSPIAVTSTTVVTNLNSDLLDGLHASANHEGVTVAARDSGGGLKATSFAVVHATSTNDNVTLGYLEDQARIRVGGVTQAAGNGFEIQAVSDKKIFRVSDNGQVTNYSSSVAPFVITSTALVSNLNVDMLDGFHSSAFARSHYADNFKGPDDLPQTYPDRATSTFFVNNVLGWPRAYGTVQTIKGYTSSATIQYFYPYNADDPIKYRYSFYNSNKWEEWREIIDSKAAANYVVKSDNEVYRLGSGPAEASYVKIAEMTTTINSSGNGLTLTVEGNSSFGTNRPGSDLLQMSTRASGGSALEIIPLTIAQTDSNNMANYGLVVNATTGLTELWMERKGYNHATKITVGQKWNNIGVLNVGILATQSTAPTGFTKVNRTVFLNQDVRTTASPTFQNITSSGQAYFNSNVNLISNAPLISLSEQDQAANEKKWWIVADGKGLDIRTVTDGDGTGFTAMSIKRGTGTAISQINFPAKLVVNAIESVVPQGTAPFAVASNTVVTNLNADMVDGKHLSEVVQGTLVYAVTTGTGAALVAAITPAPAALTSGLRLSIKTHAATTGPVTLNLNGLGAKSIKKPNGNNPTLALGGVYTLVYDGTAFILQGEGGEYGTATNNQVLQGYTIGTEDGIIAGSIPYYYMNFSPSLIDQTIPTGFHENSVLKAAPRTPEKILAGQTYIGLAGTATNDATATAADILVNKTAYSKGVRLTGTLVATKVASNGFYTSDGQCTVSGLPFTPGCVVIKVTGINNGNWMTAMGFSNGRWVWSRRDGNGNMFDTGQFNGSPFSAGFSVTVPFVDGFETLSWIAYQDSV
ncbi:hypothetical protein C2I18_14430 [Paenibacillus sp. PK3_47]|uniref:hypothetical protein n=1 Tax=Paenibacillus sp. PK3_47 TaxID=2072642 RepID=UPI00201D952D|nr:hypothetical protein [Paenibacillus sp. PK3_47]UQZ34615.1 hypothetical protein C2I18_14430 [Paenibacillus sp. PK3_47]